jgi:superfamily II DNA or RNA helicase
METFNDSTQRTIALRPYQQEALTAIAEAESKGVRRQLVALPTGTGKTVIFSHIVSNRLGRALVLAHREELIGQAAEKILTVNPAASIGVVKADRNELHRQIVVASVQTLARESRLSRIDTAGFTTVVIDEAHHAAADSYRRILEYFGCFGENGPLTVGFTATPERADEKALGEIFSEIVYRRDIFTMMRSGYLCDLRAIQVSLHADFNELHSRHGDFIDSEASAMLMAANAPAHAVEAYREHASGRKTLLFTPTVELAHRMVEEFNAQNIAAEALSGETPMDDRRGILRRLKTGATRLVANCAVLTEGFDEPSVNCIIVARPTRSKPLYVQMIGRGTRLYPSKEDCLILDLVGATTRHDLMTAASLFSVGTKPDQTIVEAVGERDAAIRFREDQETARGRLVSQTIDLFHRRTFHWVRAAETRFVLSIGKGMIILTPDENGWTARFNSREGAVQLATGRPLDWAQGISEDYAREMNAEHLINPLAPWRTRPATEKQLATLKRFRICTLPNISAGEASDLIAQAIGRIA